MIQKISKKKNKNSGYSDESDVNHTGKISPIYVKKTMVAVTFGYILFLIVPNLLWSIPVLLFVAPNVEVFWIINGAIIGSMLLVLWLVKIFQSMYVRNLSYEISNKFIVIHSGILSRNKVTIPFSRIQNVNIHQDWFDRQFNLYTVMFETAGGTANSQSGGIRPEGFIPGLLDTSKLETITNKLVHEYTQEKVPRSLEGMIFEDHHVAFDQFISYILSKVSWGEDLKTKVRELRKAKNMTQAELAEKINVTRQTINYLEQGKYIPSLPTAMLIAEVFNVDVKDIFTLEKGDKKK